MSETNVDQTNVDQTKIDETNIDQTKASETNIDQTNVDQTKIEETNVDQTKIEETNVDETNVDQTKASETKPKRMVRRSVAIALGIVCVLLIAGLGGAVAYHTMAINDKDNKINSENNTINQLIATMADQNNTIASLNANITNLTTEKNQLQTWLDGNETLLSQTQMWLSGNITSLNARISQLQTWLTGNITAYNNEVTLYNNEVNHYDNYVADHSYTNEQYQSLLNIVNLADSTIWVNDQTVSQGAGAYSTWTVSASYAGYVSVYVQNSTVAGIQVEVIYSSYGVNYNQEITVSAGSSAVFPVLPSSSITIGVGNGLYFGYGATETVTVEYYY